MGRWWKRVRRWWADVTWRPDTIEGRTAKQWVRMLRDPARAAPARAILHCFAPGVDLIDLLCRSLHDHDPQFRQEVCRVLASFGGGSDMAQRALIAATADLDAGVRTAAVTAFGICRWIDPPVAEALHRRLLDVDPAVRAAAAGVLASRLPDWVPDCVLLQRCERDDCPAVRQYVAAALAVIDS